MESAFPARGICAVFCVCPSAGHLDTKPKRGISAFPLFEPGPYRGHTPGGETMPFYWVSDNRKIEGVVVKQQFWDWSEDEKETVPKTRPRTYEDEAQGLLPN
jgi:hypothetical protein